MKFFALWLGLIGWSGTALFAQDLTDPAVILAQSQAAYATCASCTVTGQLRTDLKSTPAQHAVKEVKIWFSRPDDLFRLDWTETSFLGAKSTNSVFTRAGQTDFYWGSLNRFQHPKDRSMALAGATGISSGLAHFLPELLFGSGFSLRVSDPVLRPEETLDGYPCYVVAGTVRQGSSPFEVAIDKKTFAVVRVKETDHIKASLRQESIERLKKSNPKLAAQMADQPAVPDFDVDTVTDYQTTFGPLVTAQDCDYPVPAGMPLTEDR